MGRVQGTLLICRINSSASFVRATGEDHLLPWHRLQTRQATEAFLRHFKPTRRASTSDKHIYEIDFDESELMEWFDQAAYSTAELLRTAAHLAEQSGDLSQAERLYMRLLTVLETKIGRGSIETADVMRSLAELSYKAGNFEDGTRYFEKMQKILEERRGAN